MQTQMGDTPYQWPPRESLFDVRIKLDFCIRKTKLVAGGTEGNVLYAGSENKIPV
jgi:hypothetical protein